MVKSFLRGFIARSLPLIQKAGEIYCESIVPMDEIAKICQVGRDAVSSWIRKWEASGEAGLSDEPKSGAAAH